MAKNKTKYYKVRYNGAYQFMSGGEISLLQLSGGKVKIQRKATKEEYDNEN